MDASRFDAFSRSLARRSSRRSALRTAGLGGVLGAFIPSRIDAAFQTGSKTCDIAVHFEYATGENVASILDGRMTLKVLDDGAIDTGQLSLQGVDYPLTGNATGRGLSLRVVFPENEIIAMQGVGQSGIDECDGIIEGIFSGPAFDDLGTWRAGKEIATASGSPVAGSQAAPTVTRTPCPDIACDDAFVVDPESCQCDCPKPYDRCGKVCCFGGSECHDEATGECSCPAGMEGCQEVCTPSCAEGEGLNYDTCECEACPGQTNCPSGCTDVMTDDANCGECGNGCALYHRCLGGVCTECSVDGSACGTHNDCCNQFCQASGGGGVCSFCDKTICGSPGACVDTVNDRNNCGSCGNACAEGVPCIAGSCSCPSGYTNCGSGCSDIATDFYNCGSCGNSCISNEVCQSGYCGCYINNEDFCDGRCVDIYYNPNNCGGCGIVCPFVNQSDGSVSVQACSNGGCCSQFSQACSSDGDCCPGYPCTGGFCQN